MSDKPNTPPEQEYDENGVPPLQNEPMEEDYDDDYIGTGMATVMLSDDGELSIGMDVQWLAYKYAMNEAHAQQMKEDLGEEPMPEPTPDDELYTFQIVFPELASLDHGSARYERISDTLTKAIDYVLAHYKYITWENLKKMPKELSWALTPSRINRLAELGFLNRWVVAGEVRFYVPFNTEYYQVRKLWNVERRLHAQSQERAHNQVYRIAQKKIGKPFIHTDIFGALPRSADEMEWIRLTPFRDAKGDGKELTEYGATLHSLVGGFIFDARQLMANLMLGGGYAPTDWRVELDECEVDFFQFHVYHREDLMEVELEKVGGEKATLAQFVLEEWFGKGECQKNGDFKPVAPKPAYYFQTDSGVMSVRIWGDDGMTTPLIDLLTEEGGDLNLITYKGMIVSQHALANYDYDKGEMIERLYNREDVEEYRYDAELEVKREHVRERLETFGEDGMEEVYGYLEDADLIDEIIGYFESDSDVTVHYSPAHVEESEMPDADIREALHHFLNEDDAE